MLTLTGERVIPKLMKPRNGLLMEHIARYEFAGRFVWGRVLDIACGVGYGCEVLLKGQNRWVIKEVTGVDIDRQSIDYAREHYNFPKASFLVENAIDRSLPEKLGSFDCIISFETIEHLEDDMGFLQNLQKLLSPGGLLVISTPLGRGRGKPCNEPYHFHQYTLDEFTKMLDRYFTQTDIYLQRDVIIEKPIAKKKYYLAVALCRH
ncbi:MAG: class I SAM-dependent methyltransferase [Bacillota bacterium]